MERYDPPLTRGEFYERVDYLAWAHNASMTSGRRTKDRNRIKRGSTESKHLIGWAIDLVPDMNTWENRWSLAREAQRMGMWATAENDHVHIQGKPPNT